MRIFYVQAINANANANMGFICYVLDRYLPPPAMSKVSVDFCFQGLTN